MIAEPSFRDNHMKTLYISDLDGTLLTSHERVSPYSIEKLNRLIDGGVRFTFATARSALSAKRAVEGLHLNTPVVLYNGGLIYDYTTGETLFSVLFGNDEKEYVYSVLRTYGILPLIFGARCLDKERIAYLEGRENFGISRYLFRRQGDVRLEPVPTETELLEGFIFYFKCIGPKDQLERAWNILKYDPRFICIFHQEKYQNDFWMEISPRAATKANGAAYLGRYLGAERLICFGDTSNDSDMFDVCDESYAVMNADGWLKEKATGVIGYCEEDGVAKWMEAHAVIG